MSVKPFAEHGHYTAVHDAVFDVVMPFCPPNAFKVLLFVLRKTRGWKKDEDVLRYAEIKAGTGIKSDATLAKELDWLLKKKLLNARDEGGGEHRKGSRKAPAYSLNRDFEIGAKSSETKVVEPSTTSETEVTTTLETKASNNQSNNNHSRRDAGASPLKDKQGKNWFTFYCDLAKALDIKILPEDRERTSKHFKDLVRLESPTEAEMKKAISKILEARASGFDMSPQKALDKVRGGNVTPIRPGVLPPDPVGVSTAHYRKFT